MNSFDSPRKTRSPARSASAKNELGSQLEAQSKHIFELHHFIKNTENEIEDLKSYLGFDSGIGNKPSMDNINIAIIEPYYKDFFQQIKNLFGSLKHESDSQKVMINDLKNSNMDIEKKLKTETTRLRKCVKTINMNSKLFEEEKEALKKDFSRLLSDNENRIKAELDKEKLMKESFMRSLEEEKQKNEASIQSLEEEKENYERELVNRDQSIQSLEEEKRMNGKSIQSLEEEKRKNEKSILSLEEEKRKNEESIQSLEESIRLLEEQKVNLQQIIAQYEESTKLIEEKNISLESALMKQKDEKSNIIQMESDLDSLQSTINHLESQISKQNEELATIQNHQTDSFKLDIGNNNQKLCHINDEVSSVLSYSNSLRRYLLISWILFITFFYYKLN